MTVSHMAVKTGLEDQHVLPSLGVYDPKYWLGIVEYGKRSHLCGLAGFLVEQATQETGRILLKRLGFGKTGRKEERVCIPGCVHETWTFMGLYKE